MCARPPGQRVHCRTAGGGAPGAANGVVRDAVQMHKAVKEQRNVLTGTNTIIINIKGTKCAYCYSQEHKRLRSKMRARGVRAAAGTHSRDRFAITVHGSAYFYVAFQPRAPAPAAAPSPSAQPQEARSAGEQYDIQPRLNPVVLVSKA